MVVFIKKWGMNRMDVSFSPSDVKAILHSKRANIYYLEKCRVMQKDGRVLYLTEGKNESQFWNIPIANTTVILLGTGTSITQAAMRMLASAGVLVGFCGGGSTPLFSGSNVEWFTPQSEYRPTEYVLGWLSFWFQEEERLDVAKLIQKARIDYLVKTWGKDKDMKNEKFYHDDMDIENALTGFNNKMVKADTVDKLLSCEATFAKQLYKYSATITKTSSFSRRHEGGDLANDFLNHGNYLAYGLAATALWVLGIPHGFAVMHGKTRRGALVFDIADLVKDAIVLPWAFICAKEKNSEQEFRQICLQKFVEHKALDFMFDELKKHSCRGVGLGDEL